MQHEIKPVATFNDLVHVAGYGNNLFEVEAFTYEYHHEPDSTFAEVIYDLTCVYGDSGYIIGEQDDVTLACEAKYAAIFLQTYEPAPTAEDKPSWLRELYISIDYATGNGGVDDMASTKAPKQPTKQERIDALLDERIVVENVVDTEGWIIDNEDGYKQRRLDEIDAKLTELTAK